MAVQKGEDVASVKSPAPPSSSAAASSSAAKRKKSFASRPPRPPPPNKRPRSASLMFVDDAAAEASDDDEGDDSDSFSMSSSDDDAAATVPAANETPKGKSKDATVSNRMRHAPFFVKEEELSGDELEELIKKRYGRPAVFLGDEDKKDVDFGGPLLHPTQDPVIWKVKCMVGRERQIVLCLLQKFVDTYNMGNKLNVSSSFSVDHVKGYIFIEADKETDVMEACKGFCNLYMSRLSRISKDEIPRLLSTKKISSELHNGAWVRMKSGHYKGDLAQLIASEHHTQKAVVKLIPRINLQALAKKFGGGESLKHAIVPSPRLISSRELEDFRPHIHIKHDRLTGYEFEMLDGMMLKDGYLYKKVAVSSFSFLGVQPSKSELAKFEDAKKDNEEELHWLSNIFGERKKTKIEKPVGDPENSEGKGFEVFDLVFFGRKSFGVIVGKKCDTYEILKGDTDGGELATVPGKEIKSSCHDKMFASSDRYKKTISVNDNVKVLEGLSEGREGTVRHMYKGTLFIYDERQTENCGFFCAKSSMCENIKISKQPRNDKMVASSSFTEFEGFESKGDDSDSRRPRQMDSDSPFSVGQKLRIRVGPLKGYLCRVLSLRRSTVTVKLDSLAKIITVKNSDISEVNSKDSAGARDSGVSSNQFGTQDAPSDQGWSTPLGNSWDMQFPLTARSSFTSSFGASCLEGAKTDKDSELDVWGSKTKAQKNGSWDKEIGSSTGLSSAWNIENKSIVDQNQSHRCGWEIDSSSWNNGVGTSGGSLDAWEKTKPPDKNVDGTWDGPGKQMNPRDNVNGSWETKATDLSDSWNKNGNEVLAEEACAWSKVASTPNDACVWGKVSSATMAVDTWDKDSTPATIKNVDPWARASVGTKGDDIWNNAQGQTKPPDNGASVAVGSAFSSKEEAICGKAATTSTEEAAGWSRSPVIAAADANEKDAWGKAVASKSTLEINDGWGKSQVSTGDTAGWGKTSDVDSGPVHGWDKPRPSGGDAGTTWEKKGSAGTGGQEQASGWGKSPSSGTSWENKESIGGWAGSRDHDQTGGWNKPNSSGTDFGNSCNKGGNDRWGSDKRPSTGGGSSGGGSACFKCGQPGHLSRECPLSGGGGGGGAAVSNCYNCGQPGHRARECPSAPTGGGSDCFKCGQPGHRARECPSASAGGSGGGGDCFSCGQSGHRARDCPSATGGRGASDCFKCGQSGHFARECPSPGGGIGRSSGSNCFKCGQAGHQARECPSAGGKQSWSGGQKNGGWGNEIGSGTVSPWNKDNSGGGSSWEKSNPPSKTTERVCDEELTKKTVLSGGVCNSWEQRKTDNQPNSSAGNAWSKEGQTGEKGNWPKAPAATHEASGWEGVTATGKIDTLANAISGSLDLAASSKEENTWVKAPKGTVKEVDGWGKHPVTASADTNKANVWDKTTPSGDVGTSWEKKSLSGVVKQDQASGWIKSKSSDDGFSTPWEKRGLADSSEQDQATGWSKPKSSGIDFGNSWDKGGNDKWGSDKRPSGGQGSSSGRSDCFKCGQPGHRARECPSSGGGGGGARGSGCFNCGQSGHRAKECPSSLSSGGGGGSSDCFKCGQPGHRARECPSSGSGGGGGSGFNCFKCGQPGHRARDCSSSDDGDTRYSSGPKHSEHRGGGWGNPSSSGSVWGKPVETGKHGEPDVCGNDGGWGKPGDSERGNSSWKKSSDTDKVGWPKPGESSGDGGCWAEGGDWGGGWKTSKDDGDKEGAQHDGGSGWVNASQLGGGSSVKPGESAGKSSAGWGDAW